MKLIDAYREFVFVAERSRISRNALVWKLAVAAAVVGGSDIELKAIDMSVFCKAIEEDYRRAYRPEKVGKHPVRVRPTVLHVFLDWCFRQGYLGEVSIQLPYPWLDAPNFPGRPRWPTSFILIKRPTGLWRIE